MLALERQGKSEKDAELSKSVVSLPRTVPSMLPPARARTSVLRLQTNTPCTRTTHSPCPTSRTHLLPLKHRNTVPRLRNVERIPLRRILLNGADTVMQAHSLVVLALGVVGARVGKSRGTDARGVFMTSSKPAASGKKQNFHDDMKGGWGREERGLEDINL